MLKYSVLLWYSSWALVFRQLWPVVEQGFLPELGTGTQWQGWEGVGCDDLWDPQQVWTLEKRGCSRCCSARRDLNIWVWGDRESLFGFFIFKAFLYSYDELVNFGAPWLS